MMRFHQKPSLSQTNIVCHVKYKLFLNVYNLKKKIKTVIHMLILSLYLMENRKSHFIVFVVYRLFCFVLHCNVFVVIWHAVFIVYACVFLCSTVFFAQHEEQVSSAVFELSVQVGHQSNQTIPQGVALFRFSASIL